MARGRCLSRKAFEGVYRGVSTNRPEPCHVHQPRTQDRFRHRRVARASRRARRLGPAPFRRIAPASARGRRDRPARRDRVGVEPHSPSGGGDDAPGDGVRGSRARLLLRVAERRPLPRQRVPAPARRRRGVPRPALARARHGEPGPRPGVPPHRRSPPRPSARHRPHRLRQEHHAGGAGGPHQRHAPRTHPHHRGPGGVHPRAPRLTGHPAPTRPRHRQLRRRLARRPARRPGRHPGRRNARPRNHPPRPDRRRNRPPWCWPRCTPPRRRKR